jgi:hypothetical protein
MYIVHVLKHLNSCKVTVEQHSGPKPLHLLRNGTLKDSGPLMLGCMTRLAAGSSWMTSWIRARVIGEERGEIGNECAGRGARMRGLRVRCVVHACFTCECASRSIKLNPEKSE